MSPEHDVGRIDKEVEVRGFVVDVPGPDADSHGFGAVDPADADLIRRLQEVWSTVLGVQVGPDDDFFELGGNSLFAVRIAAKIRERGLPALPLRTIYRHPTVRGLAEAARTRPPQ